MVLGDPIEEWLESFHKSRDYDNSPAIAMQRVAIFESQIKQMQGADWFGSQLPPSRPS